MMNGGLSASDVAVLSGSNNRADEGYGFGGVDLGDIFGDIFGGGFGGFGGWGGNGGNGTNGAGFQGWATRADINESFALNDIQNGIRGIQQGICDIYVNYKHLTYQVHNNVFYLENQVKKDN